MSDSSLRARVEQVKRYDLVTNYRAGSSIEEMEPADDGEWARFEDLAALLAAPLNDTDNETLHSYGGQIAVTDFLTELNTALLAVPEDHPMLNGWPEAVSDGLTLPCADCGEVPRFDYVVTDEFWTKHVPLPDKRGVVCLPCLDRRCHGVGLAEALSEIQWTGSGHTVVCKPTFRHTYEPTPAQLAERRNTVPERPQEPWQPLWQDISTAPKDGAEILVAGRDWVALSHGRSDGRWWTRHPALVGTRPHCGGQAENPTHWALPPVPPSPPPQET